MGTGGDPRGAIDPEKWPLPGSEDAFSKEGLLPPAEIPAPRTDHKLRCFLRRGTGPRFLAVYLAVLVLVVLALGVYIAVLKSTQCPDPQIHAPEEASRVENVKNGEVLPPYGDEWIWLWDKCYFFSEKEANWDDAKHACASLNSSLAVIDNQREMVHDTRSLGLRLPGQVLSEAANATASTTGSAPARPKPILMHESGKGAPGLGHIFAEGIWTARGTHCPKHPFQPPLVEHLRRTQVSPSGTTLPAHIEWDGQTGGWTGNPVLK